MGTDDATLKIMKEHIETLFGQVQAAKTLLLRGAADFEAERAKRLNNMALLLQEKLGEDHPDVRRLRENASEANALRCSFLQEAEPEKR